VLLSPAMRASRIAFSLPLACLWLSGCAPMGSGRHTNAAPADSLAIAYVPGSMGGFADYRSYRDDYSVVTEFSGLDLALRQSDFYVEEIGPEGFPALRRLGAEPASGADALRGLHCNPNRVLVVVQAPVEGDGRISGKTMASDIAHNILEVGDAITSIQNQGFFRKPVMRHTSESGHGFRAILYDKAQGRVLLDTVSTLLTSGTRVPGQSRDESPADCHYRTFVKACLKAKPVNAR
jgi:hypothetical protein